MPNMKELTRPERYRLNIAMQIFLETHLDV